MRGQLRLDVRAEGPLCRDCPVRDPCGAAESDQACRTAWGDALTGGVNVLHPRNPDTWEYLREIDGPEFDDIVARAQERLQLPAFFHQIRPVRILRGELLDPMYAVGPAKTVDRRRVLRCERLRELTGLDQDQEVGLLLFGKDDVLERLWARRFEAAAAIAAGNYYFCVAPSYSNYTGRPRPEFLYNAKRSLVFFQLLQEHGAHAIPRVAWLHASDARRFARWANANPTVDVVALDLASSSEPYWRQEIALLALFDRLTRRRLSYLIHGPGTVARCVDLYRLLGLRRVHLTNARAIARPAAPGTSYVERFATERTVIDSARRLTVDANDQAASPGAVAFSR